MDLDHASGVLWGGGGGGEEGRLEDTEDLQDLHSDVTERTLGSLPAPTSTIPYRLICTEREEVCMHVYGEGGELHSHPPLSPLTPSTNPSPLSAPPLSPPPHPMDGLHSWQHSIHPLEGLGE